MNDQFGPIIEPSPIAFSFAAPGWTYLAYFLAACTLISTGIWYYRFLKNAYRREALKYISELEDIGSINKVLKSVAVQKYDRKTVAELYGLPWLTFLINTSKPVKSELSNLAGILDKSWSKSPVENYELDQFKSFSIHWIRTHHV